MGSKPSMNLERFEALARSNPREARRLLDSLRTKVLVPHSEGQKAVLECEQRFMVLCAGRRWGKTKVGAARALRVCRRRNKRVAWVAPVYKNVKHGYAEVLSQIPDGLLTKTPSADTAFDAGRAVTLHFKTGSRMTFYSAERPEGMLGQALDFVVLDEAAKMPSHVWDQVIRPTLADHQGSALFISTPVGRNWFYRIWQQGQDELQHHYASWRFPSYLNPTIPAQEWEQMRQTMPEFTYNQEVEADFISNAAAVFRGVDDAISPKVRPLGHIFMGVDLAKHYDFTVITAARAGDRRPVWHDRFREVSWPEQRRRIREAVDTLEAQSSGVTVLLDSTGVGDVVYDDLSYEGLDVVPITFTPSWKQKAVMLLAADLERHDAWILQDQLSEFQGYSYKIGDTGRWKFEASSGHDDEVSAKLLEHWGLVNEGSPNVSVITADASGMGEEEASITDGQRHEPLEEPAAARSPLELMNDPAVWH